MGTKPYKMKCDVCDEELYNSMAFNIQLLKNYTHRLESLKCDVCETLFNHYDNVLWIKDQLLKLDILF